MNYEWGWDVFMSVTRWPLCYTLYMAMTTGAWVTVSCLWKLYPKGSVFFFWTGVDHSQLVDLAKAAFSFLPKGEPAAKEASKYHGGNA